MFEREPGHDPRKNLWQAVMLRTVEDALLGVSQEYDRKKRIRACKEARDYLTKPSRDLGEVCTMAGMDMQAVIEHMRVKIAEAPTPEELADNPRQSVSTFEKAPKKPKVKRIPFGDKKFTFNGKTRTAAEWCKKTGIPLPLVKGRLDRAWPPERAFTMTIEQALQGRGDRARQSFSLTSEECSARIKEGPRRYAELNGPRKRRASPNTPRYAHDGLNLTLAEWADRTGLKKVTLFKRLNSGWTFADAISTPTRPKKEKDAA